MTFILVRWLDAAESEQLWIFLGIHALVCCSGAFYILEQPFASGDWWRQATKTGGAQKVMRWLFWLIVLIVKFCAGLGLVDVLSSSRPPNTTCRSADHDRRFFSNGAIRNSFLPGFQERFRRVPKFPGSRLGSGRLETVLVACRVRPGCAAGQVGFRCVARSGLVQRCRVWIGWRKVLAGSGAASRMGRPAVTIMLLGISPGFIVKGSLSTSAELP